MPEIDAVESPTYKRFNVAGVFGGTRPGGVHAVLYSERMNAQKALTSQPPQPQRVVIKRTIECELVIDPLQLKSIYDWVGSKIKEYETMYGRILSPEEIASRAKRSSE